MPDAQGLEQSSFRASMHASCQLAAVRIPCRLTSLADVLSLHSINPKLAYDESGLGFNLAACLNLLHLWMPLRASNQLLGRPAVCCVCSTCVIGAQASGW